MNGDLLSFRLDILLLFSYIQHVQKRFLIIVIRGHSGQIPLEGVSPPWK